MPEASIAPTAHRDNHVRLLLAAAVLVAIFLASLAFSAGAQAAGASAQAWGYNNYGQLGTGAVSENSCNCIPTPNAVSGLSDATQISGGSAHTLALHADGTVTAWGYNSFGQLGNGTIEHSETPVKVSGLSNVVAVEAGYEHSLALLADGTVMAWGANEQGELGVGGSDFSGGGPTCGTHACSDVPLQVPGLSDVVAIGAGYYTSFALLANGTVMAWGFDDYGQLGDGVGIESGCECQERPVAVPGVSGAMAISVGDDHAMALLSGGGVTVWGENYNGQAGNGTSIQSGPPPCLCVGPTSASSLAGPAKEIAAGGYQNFALLGDGTPQAWGFNGGGELGNGSTAPLGGCECVPTAAPVSGLSAVQSLAADGRHTLALLSDGSIRAWGKNAFGQVGYGSEEVSSTPVPVSGVNGASDVATGEHTSFALIGPSHTLTVQLAGAGAGAVGGPKGIICPAVNCVSRLPDSQVEILRAEAAPSSGFAGFTGPCTGTGTCQVKMDTDQTVTATFGPPKGTKITKAQIKQGKKPKKGSKRKPKRAKASFSFTTPGVVSDYQCMLVRPKAKRKRRQGKRLPLARKRRAMPRFVKCKSPQRYKKLRKGRYTFKVRARNSLGIEARPAVRKFRIKR